jgi:hypothetical protein
MLLLLLASLGRCASAELCPTEEALAAAVAERNADENAAVAVALAEDGGHAYGPPPLRGIRRVRCGEVSPLAPRSVNCSYELRYGRRRVHEIATLVRDGGRWRIVERLSVDVTAGGRGSRD